MMSHCVTCGEALDQFGICPFTDPELARLARAPVSCGRSTAENAVRVAEELAVAKLPTMAATIQPIWKGVSEAEAKSLVRNFMGIAGDQSRESR